MNPVRLQSPAQLFARRYVRFVAACSFAVVALLVGNSSVEASCGDYLHGPMTAHGDFSTGNSRALSVDEFQISNERPACPCQGLTCKRGPTKSPLPTAGIQVEYKDRWLEGWLIELTLVDESPEYARHSEVAVLPLFAFRLDRPPKA